MSGPPEICELRKVAESFGTANAARVLALGADALVLATEANGTREMRLLPLAATVADWRANGWASMADAVDAHVASGTGVIVIVTDAIEAGWFASPIRWVSKPWPGGRVVAAAEA